MTSHLSDELLQQLSDFVAARLGLHFPEERWRDLVRGISSAAREFHFADTESCVRWLLAASLTRGQIEILASHFTVGETYFFREPGSLDVLRDRILPELLGARRKGVKQVRVWSAACSTGEEAYTLAILLDKLLPDIGEWQITILATDINPHSLQKASEGVYGEWSFRGTPRWLREKYFARTKGNRFAISPRLKEMVTFAYLNLVEDVYPSLSNNTNGMDVILCRNVLMYFTPEQADKVIRQLNLSLVDGGWLVVSPVEASQIPSSCFAPVNFADAILHQKIGYRPRATESLLSRPEGGAELLSLPAPPPPDAAGPELVSAPVASVQLKADVAVSPSPEEEAQRLYEQGRYVEVVDKILEFVAHEQADANALGLLARAYANQGKLGEAFEWCEKALAADQVHPGLHYLSAIILQEQGRAGEAAVALRRALYLDQDFVLAHFALGNLTRRQGRVKESAKHFQNALALLRSQEREEVLPESDGITAGRLTEIISSTVCGETLA